MNKHKFQVIKGTKDKIPTETYRYIKGYATNTRFMGVIGLRIYWRAEDGHTFHQFFHLDAEEYGLDDYRSLINGNPREIHTITHKMMGGLGGKLISVTEREAKYLLKTFVEKSKKFNQPLPLPQEEYSFILKDRSSLSEEGIQRLWNKICEKVLTPIQVVNYFIMRAVGCDHEALNYLSKESIDYRPVKKPSTLLKNVIETIEENGKKIYMTESLVDMGNRYKVILSQIEVEEETLKVSYGEIKSIMNITSQEAAFALTKREYLLIYDVKHVGKVMELLDKEKPHAMKHGYELGYLYTEFNPTNEHVNKEKYDLNGDIYGVYYITAGEQLIIASYSQERMDELEEYFSKDPFEEWLCLEEKMELDNTLIYEFVHSEYDNIYDFLDEE